jgi:hypothetical protein
LVSHADTLYGRDDNTIIFRDEEIDLTIADAIAKFPNLTATELKQCSYAMLIYDRLRCGYAHEYCPRENITHVPASQRKARISYIARFMPHGKVIRYASFHLEYLIQIAEHHAHSVNDQESPRPKTWWIDAV